MEPLVGRDTVNTMPEVTIEAFARLGRIRPRAVEEDAEHAARVFRDLEAVGVNMEAVTEQLISEGAQKFVDPFDRLIAGLEERRQEVLRDSAIRLELSGATPPGVTAALEALREQRFTARLFAGDPTLWSSEPLTQATIADRLGWTRGTRADSGLPAVRDFAREVLDDGLRHVVLLGMGGSSLSALVAADTFGQGEDRPEILVLDDTDPEAVRRAEERIHLPATLFMVASKSGTTVETMSLYRYFFDRLADSGAATPGRHFVALTDDGSPLLREAEENGFRQVFRTPADVGGRYSALTAFGLLPITLTGADLDLLLSSARQAEMSCSPAIPETHNPAVRLGVHLGLHVGAGRDKVTIVASPGIRSFPLWIEQLLAESTGKSGTGIVPVVGEELGLPETYGDDRVFVHLRLADESDQDRRLAALVDANHPVISITLPTRESLGGEFLRWEIATATAGALLRVNPFDEPDVKESKLNTARLLELWEAEDRFPSDEPVITAGGLEAFLDRGLGWASGLDLSSLQALVTGFVELAGHGEYVAILGYFARTAERAVSVRGLRQRIREKTGAATTFGYGPRYLHSTGQLHKGGPDSGVFLMLTADAAEDLPIPGAAYGFAALQRAQALGDFEALTSTGRRVLRVNLGWYPDQGLRTLGDFMAGT